MQSEKGFSLIETLIAVAIFGLISVSVSMSLSMAAKSNIISDELTTAGTLARSQTEYVQTQTYDSVNNPPVYSMLSGIPDGYSIATTLATRLDPKNDGTGNDDGLQKITVTVKRGTRTILSLEDYKVNK